MLGGMKSPAFKEKGEVRPKIEFHPGLNVVLGKEGGENSIGKSSAMLAIDFVFGGNAYLSGDGVNHIGDHTIFFAFEFGNKNTILHGILVMPKKSTNAIKTMI